MGSDELTEIGRFHYRYQGELARGYLEDAGIPCLLTVDDAGGAEVGLAFVNPARLRVRAEDVDEAREVLRDAGIVVDPSGDGEAEGQPVP